MHVISKATYKLINNKKLYGRALCFLAHPTDGYADQNAAIFWVLFDNPNLPVYFDAATGITQTEGPVVTSVYWYNAISKHYTKNFITITRVLGGFRFTSTNLSKVHFGQLDDKGYSLGEKIVYQKESIKGEKVVTDFTLLLNSKYLETNPVFLRWDYVNKKFIIID